MAVSAPLMEVSFIADALLILTNSSSLFEPFHHLSFEAHLLQLTFSYHFQHRGSGDPAFTEGGVTVGH